MTDREIAHEIIGKLLDADVEAFERTITDAENTVYHVLQQVKSVDLADVVKSWRHCLCCEKQQPHYQVLHCCECHN